MYALCLSQKISIFGGSLRYKGNEQSIFFLHNSYHNKLTNLNHQRNHIFGYILAFLKLSI